MCFVKRNCEMEERKGASEKKERRKEPEEGSKSVVEAVALDAAESLREDCFPGKAIPVFASRDERRLWRRISACVTSSTPAVPNTLTDRPPAGPVPSESLLSPRLPFPAPLSMPTDLKPA